MRIALLADFPVHTLPGFEDRQPGLPVVTTPNGGQSQYVEHAKSGFIHPAGDIEGLIQGVLALTENRAASPAMGTHGQAACRAALAPQVTAARLINTYQTMTSQG